MVHELKIYPEYLKEVLSGDKTFEVRKNDRPYTIGDTIHFREFNKESNEYGAIEADYIISYILCDGEYVKDGFVVLGIKPCDMKRSLSLYMAWDILHNKEKNNNGWYKEYSINH